MVELSQWNHPDKTINQVIVEDDFSKNYFPFTTNYSVLKSDPNLSITQTTHCDQAAPYSFSRRAKFNFSAIVGIKNQGFLDIKYTNQESVEHVLIEKGGIIFVRNGIPHRGCKNLTDYEHHQIHCFYDPACLHDNSDGNLTIIADAFDDPPFIDKTTNTFVNRFK